MNYPKEIETIRVEIARLTSLIDETRQRVAVIEAEEMMAVRDEVSERLHNAALIIRLEKMNEYVGLRKTLRESRTRRAILRAQLEQRRGEFKLALLDKQVQLSEEGAALS
jgi:hypothetical protein